MTKIHILLELPIAQLATVSSSKSYAPVNANLQKQSVHSLPSFDKTRKMSLTDVYITQILRDENLLRIIIFNM